MVRIDPRSTQLPERFHSACDLVNTLIARKAKQLAGRYRWGDRDAEDIESDLWLAILRSWDQNPEHPNPEALTTVVVQRACISMLRRRRSQRRDPDRRISEFEYDTLAAPDRDGDTDLRLDVAELSMGLTPAARALVEDLREDTMAGISRRTGTPRSTLYGRLEEIRENFKTLADTLSPDRDVKGGDTP
jgi:DNA-directed RNA polymerase specialized sigma24 family protein